MDTPGTAPNLEEVAATAAALSGATAGVQYTYSKWVKAGAGANGKTVRLVIREIGGAVATGTTAIQLFTLTTAWQRLILTGTIVQNDRTGVRGGFVTGNSGTPVTTGDVVLIDDAQFEPGSVATPYIHTDGATASRPALRWLA